MINEDKNQRLSAVIERLKSINKKKEISEPERRESDKKLEVKMERKIQTEEDFRRLPYEGKVRYDFELKNLNQAKTQTNEPTKQKTCFWEHYDKEGPYEPAFLKLSHHPNPSGRPPNIPDSMYEGINVVPRRPWVYDGDSEMPSVGFGQNNDQAFKNIMKQTKEDKLDHINKKTNVNEPRTRKKKLDDGNDQQLNSNFDISDSLYMSMDSMLYSQLKSGRNEKDNEDMESEQLGRTSRKKPVVFDESEESQSQYQNQQMSEFNSDQHFPEECSQSEDVKPKKKRKNRS